MDGRNLWGRQSHRGPVGPLGNALRYCALLRMRRFRGAIAADFSHPMANSAYDFNFSISAIAPAGALTFPSWMK
jgi:hypothetical protein